MLAAAILLIILGIVLILVEIFFIPGIGIAGGIGLAMMIAGVICGYTVDQMTGNISLAVSGTTGLLMAFVALRAKTWERYGLKSQIASKVNIIPENELNPGDEGVAMGRLAPSGKAEIKGHILEVHTEGLFIDPGTQIRVISIIDHKIIVKPK